jgi:hypothetical protein
VARVIQILGRRTKNNPILLGEPGARGLWRGIGQGRRSRQQPGGRRGGGGPSRLGWLLGRRARHTVAGAPASPPLERLAPVLAPSPCRPPAPPGVGKTAIAEGLAVAIVTNASLDGSPLPAFLRSKRILQLDVSPGGGGWGTAGGLGVVGQWWVRRQRMPTAGDAASNSQSNAPRDPAPSPPPPRWACLSRALRSAASWRTALRGSSRRARRRGTWCSCEGRGGRGARVGVSRGPATAALA